MALLKKTKCEKCLKEIRSFSSSEYHCNWCNCSYKSLCSDCHKDKESKIGPIEMCRKCRDSIIPYLSDFQAVKSGHVQGHDTLEKKNIITSGYWRDWDDAIMELKCMAIQVGANAILELKTVPISCSSGNYLYKEHRAEGIPARIEKRGSSKL